MDKELIVEKLEEAFETKGASIQKYVGTHIYTDIRETKVSVKVDGGFAYPTLNEAITMKIQGKEILYLNPKPTRAVVTVPQTEKIDDNNSETKDEEKTETANILNTNSEIPEEKTLETEQVKDILDEEAKETADVDTSKPTEEVKAPEKSVVKPFVKTTK